MYYIKVCMCGRIFQMNDTDYLEPSLMNSPFQLFWNEQETRDSQKMC